MIYRNQTTGRFQNIATNGIPVPTYRDPDTGRFITRSRWEQLRENVIEEFDDWDDLSDFEELGEEQTYGDEE